MGEGTGDTGDAVGTELAGRTVSAHREGVAVGRPVEGSHAVHTAERSMEVCRVPAGSHVADMQLLVDTGVFDTAYPVGWVHAASMVRGAVQEALDHADQASS